MSKKSNEKPASNAAANNADAHNEKNQNPTGSAVANAVEALIERKVLEAKLAMTESRVDLLVKAMGFVTVVFGIAIPLWLTNQNRAEVDRAVQRMESRFKELAADQLRRPEITCEFDGKPLLNADAILTVSVLTKKFSTPRKSTTTEIPGVPSGSFHLRNSGDRSAGEVRVYLLMAELPKYIDLYESETGTPVTIAIRRIGTDNTDGNVRKYLLVETSNLHAKRGFTFGLAARSEQAFKEELRLPAVLEIYYDAPEPIKIPFNIRILPNKEGATRPSDSNRPQG